MARGAAASSPSNGAMALTAEELHEILECEKIVHFRDAVLAGTHPRIKVPANLNSKSATRHTSSPSSLTPRALPSQIQDEPSSGALRTHSEESHNLYSS